MVRFSAVGFARCFRVLARGLHCRAFLSTCVARLLLTAFFDCFGLITAETSDHADAPIGGIPSGTYRTEDGRLVDR